MATKLRRYPIRALVLGILPPGISAFYLIIYLKWLQSTAAFADIETGAWNASLVFYGWFIISVFGLSLGEYGLAGSEAGMLMTRLGKTPHGGHILLHVDKTWTGLGGWAKALKIFWAWRSLPSLTWTILATTTLISYIAFPLSGLTLELRTGYTLGSKPATVYGANSSTFSVFNSISAFQHAVLAWSTGRLERPPGQSTIYTSSPLDEPLTDLSTQGVPLIFVGPQSDSIISGKAWGVAAQYNCSVIERLQDFVLYKHRNSTVERGFGHILGDPFKSWEGSAFAFKNWTAFPQEVGVSARLEIATSLDPWGLHINGWQYKEQNVVSLDDNGEILEFIRDYPGLDKPAVIELVLWQVMDPYNAGLVPGVELGLGPTVADLFDTSGESNITKPGVPVPAIGISCSCASAIGHAEIDGFRRTFANFVVDKGVDIVDETTRRTEVPFTLGYAAYHGPQTELEDESGNWVQRLFSSVHRDSAIMVRSPVNDSFVLPRLLTAEDLRRSMIQLFGSYVNQLMYRGYQATTARAGGEMVWVSEEVKVAEQTLVLGEGVLHPLVVVALLFVWAGTCAILAVCYGFRRRWAETMDGYSVMRFGADAVRSGVYDDLDVPREMEDCTWLRRLPGMVGDGCPGYEPGYVALSETVVDKRKKYM